MVQYQAELDCAIVAIGMASRLRGGLATHLTLPSHYSHSAVAGLAFDGMLNPGAILKGLARRIYAQLVVVGNAFVRAASVRWR